MDGWVVHGWMDGWIDGCIVVTGWMVGDRWVYG